MMQSLPDILQYLISGLAQGSIYAIVALGFTIIFSSTQVVNFAQGEFVMLGAMGTYMLTKWDWFRPDYAGLNWPLWLAVPAAALLTLGVGILLGWVIMRPLKDASSTSLIIITIGASIVMQGVASQLWGKDAVSAQPFTDKPALLINIPKAPYPVVLDWQQCWVMGLAAAMVLGLTFFFNRTLVGKAMRAVSVNRHGARLMGINVSRMVVGAFALSALIGALAGAAISPISCGYYNMGSMMGLKGFAAAIVGGLGNFPGSIVAGLLLGRAGKLRRRLHLLGIQGRLRLRHPAAGAGDQPQRAAGALPARKGGGMKRTSVWTSTWLWAVVGFVLVAITPLCIHNNYWLGVLAFIAIYTIVAVGLNLLMGYAGQASLGHAAFFGIGAYTTAILTTHHHVSPWLALLAGILISSAIAYLVGVPCLRLRGHYLAMATLGFGWIIYIVMVHWDTLTGGTSGIESIPKLAIGPLVFDTDTKRFYLTWVFTIAMLVLSANIVNSRVGRALRAVHSSERAAATLGVNIARYKVQVFVLSAAFAALAGSLYAHVVNFISPNTFGFIVSVELVVMVVIGGMASVWGALLGAGSITLLNEWLRTVSQQLAAALHTGTLELDMIAYGAILVLVMVFMPSGLTVGMRDLVLRLVRRRPSPSPTPPQPAREVISR